MSRYAGQRAQKAGMPPGSLVHTGKKVSEKTIIEVFDYNAEEYKEYRFTEDDILDFEILPPIGKGMVRWINVDGLQIVDIIERVCKPFHIHSLVMEDILNTAQRPKIEDYDTYLYIVAKMLHFIKDEQVNEQFSIILGNSFILTFGERKGDVFDLIRGSIRNDRRIRNLNADYLAYSLLDAIVDGYFYILERLGDKIDTVEEELLNNPSIDCLHTMQSIKRDLLKVHRSVLPLREVASWMGRNENILIQKSTQLFIRDVYDHIIQAVDIAESYRELLSGLMDIYLSSVNNKLNEVMKVLTVISTIFIPLTFIAGIYGMNFKYMPELGWKWGYGAVLAVMAAIAIAMIFYFKKKKWF